MAEFDVNGDGGGAGMVVNDGAGGGAGGVGGDGGGGGSGYGGEGDYYYDDDMGDGAYYGEDDDDEGTDPEGPIAAEDTWHVIDAYFDDKGLVRQQLDSFDEFVNNTMKEIVDEETAIKIVPQNQYLAGGSYEDDVAESERTFLKIKFGQTYLSSPSVHESDGLSHVVYPNEARLRNLTYASQLFIDVHCAQYRHNPTYRHNPDIYETERYAHHPTYAVAVDTVAADAKV